MERPNMKHFVDEHALIPMSLDAGEEIYCKACDLLIFEPFNGCIECENYFHDHCLNISRSIIHPSHPSHPLTLLSAATYPSGSFFCNACGKTGNGFIYSCAHCEFDIHLMCATLLPEEGKRVDEHPHDLKLVFRSLDIHENMIFTCDVCGDSVGNDIWRYYCEGCDFGVHVGCVKEVTAGTGGLVYVVAEGKSGTAVVFIEEEEEDDEEDDEEEEEEEEAEEDAEMNSYHLSNELLQFQLQMAKVQANMIIDARRALRNL